MIDLDELETLTYDEWIEDNGTVIERAEAIGLLIRRVRQVEAERDAAVAATERVRAAVKPWGSILSAAKGEVLAALDGAPEPEWEYGLGNRKSPLDAGIHYPDEAHVRWLASALEETPTFGPQLMRRRKAGPWLPVEGESK